MTFNFLYHPLVLAVAASCVPVSTALSQLAVSLSISGAKLDFVWVPLDAPEGAKRVEIGDFSGKHPKERKRSESIYAPFEQNGKRGYYLGKTEVTAEQWAAVTGQGSPSKLPVTGKTYTEIQEFLDKLNGLVRESGDIPRTPDGAEGIVKLPTEAEWEYAVRGAEGPAYKADDPYEGDLERYEVFYLPGSDGKAKEVGSRPPNNLGLHDMLGNVRELMDGSYSVGGVAGGGFLLKGGSYLSERAELRSSGRTEQQRIGKDGSPSRRPDAGVRLCLSAEIYTSLGKPDPELPPDDIGGQRSDVPDATNITNGGVKSVQIDAVLPAGGLAYEAKLVNLRTQETEVASLEVGEVEVRSKFGTKTIPDLLTPILPQLIPPKTLFCLHYENCELKRFLHYDLASGRLISAPMPDDLDPYFGPPSLSPAGDKIAYISFDRNGSAGYRVRSYPSLRLIKASGMRPLYGSDAPWMEPEWISDSVVRFDAQNLVEEADKNQWRSVEIGKTATSVEAASSIDRNVNQLEVEDTGLTSAIEEEPPDPPGPDSTGFRKAAERGDADAQNNLGASYANGNGVPQNYALAVKWYRKSAKQGNSMAQKNLGVCYFNGQGVPRDFVEAYKWYSVAAANGEGSKAARYRDDAGRYLTPSQLARAQAEAAQLFDQLRNGR